MKAARFHGALDVRIEDVQGPRRELAPGEILLRNTMGGICGTDLHEYKEGPIATRTVPHPISRVANPTIMGHEYAGMVEGVGLGVSKVVPGDRVSVQPHHFCGLCAPCLSGRQQLCVNRMSAGFSWPWGGLAEYSLLGEAQVALVPASMSDAAAALVEPAAVALHAVSSAPVRMGDTVFVAGGGPIGQLAGMAARTLGAGTVVLSETNSGRRERARSLGFDHVFDPRTDTVSDVLSSVGPGLAQVALECSGIQAGLDACLDAVAIGGTVIQTAMHTAPASIDLARSITRRDVTLRGVLCYSLTSWPLIISLINAGRMPVEEVLTSTIALDDLVQGGFERLSNSESGEVKIMIAIS